MKKVSLTVEGMSCSHCERAVINALEDLGVISATASAKGKVVVVEYDPEKISLDVIKNEILEVGYIIKI